MALSFAQALFENFADTALLAREGVSSLEYLLFVNAVLSAAILSSLGQVIDRWDRVRFGAGLFLGVAALLVGLRVVTAASPPGLYAVTYVLAAQVTAVFVLLFWLLAGDVFDARQSKRLFPLLSAGGIAGAAAGNFASPAVSALVGVDDVLLVAAGVVAVTAVALARSRAALFEGRGSRRARRDPGLAGVTRLVRGSLLLRLLVVITLVPGVLKPILDYQLMFLVERRAASEQGLMVFWGTFKGAFTLLSLVLQVFVTGRLLGRVGLSRTLMLSPVSFTIAFAALLLRFDLTVSMAAKVVERVVQSAIESPTKKTLYAFFHDELRGRVSVLMKGIVSRAGAVIGTLTLIVLVPWWGPRWVSAVAGLCSLASVIAVAVLHRRYQRVVAESIRSRHLDVERRAREARLEVPEAADERLLRSLAEGDRRERTLAAILLAGAGRPGPLEALVASMPALPPEARVGALEVLEEARAGPRLARAAPDGARRAVDEAWSLRLAALAQDADLGERVGRGLSSRDAALRAEAIVVATRTEDAALRARAIDVLGRWLADPSPADAARLADVLRRADRRALEPLLLDELDRMTALPGDEVAGAARSGRDSTPLEALAGGADVVADAALEALAVLRPAAAAELCVELLADPAAPRRAACLRLLGGEHAAARFDALAPWLGHPDARIAAAAADALGSGGEAVRAPLLELLGDAPLRVAAGAAHALGRCSASPVPTPVLARYVERAFAAVTRRAALGGIDSPAARLAHRVAGEHVEAARRAVLALLASHDHAAVLGKALFSPDRREVAIGCEGAEQLAPAALRRSVGVLFDAGPDRARVAHARDALGLDADDADSALSQLARDGHDVDRRLVAWVGPRLRGEGAVTDPVELFDHVTFFQSVPLFDDLSVAELLVVAEHCEERAFRAGEVVFAAGDDGDSVFFVVDGSVDIVRRDGAEEVLLTTLSAGDYFGEMSLLERTPRSATARAAAPLRLLQIVGGSFEELMREYPGISLAMCRTLSGRLRMTSRRD